MIQELDTVILVKDYPDKGLVEGDVGAGVLMRDGCKAYEVEFVTLAGATLGVLTPTADQIRPISVRAVPHEKLS